MNEDITTIEQLNEANGSSLETPQSWCRSCGKDFGHGHHTCYCHDHFDEDEHEEEGEADCEVDYCDSTIDDDDAIYGGAAIPGDAEPETGEDLWYDALVQMSDVGIRKFYDANPDLTLKAFAIVTGKTVRELKEVLRG